jgi:hypothetical protein
MLATGTNDFAAVADQSFLGRSAQDSGTAHWQSILGGSNDDAGWIILALWKIAWVSTLPLSIARLNH